MLSHEYLSSVPLCEKLYRRDASLAAQIYSPELISFLRDGFIVFPQAIDPDLLDRHEAELNDLPTLAANSLLHGMITIDGKAEHYKARVLRNLTSMGITDFRDAGPGLKLNDLFRYLEGAKGLAFADPVMRFLDELFGSPPALIQSLTFWKSSEQSVHQDFVYTHHHNPLGHLAAAWIPLEDIHADSGPLVYYRGSHLLEPAQFFHWWGDDILAGRDTANERGQEYTRHLQALIHDQGWEPAVHLPRRGDVFIWHGALIHGGTTMRDPSRTRRSFVCHYTSASAHKAVADKRVSGGFNFFEPPSLPESMRPRPLPHRLAGAAKRRLQRLLPG